MQSLAAGQTVTDTITVTISDGKGGTATKDITITITGANDNPTIGGVATGAVKEDGTLTTAGQLTKSDIDTNDTHTGPSPTAAMASTASSRSTRQASGPIRWTTPAPRSRP